MTRIFGPLSLLLVLGFFAIAIGIPLAAVLAQVKWSLVLFDSEITEIAWVTFKQASLSTGIAGLGGLLGGLWLGQALSFGKVRGSVETFSLMALALPFGVPTVVAAIAWSEWLEGSSISFSLSAVILAHVFFNLPWVVLSVAQVVKTFPRAESEAAHSLGANSLAVFRFVLWPRIRVPFVTVCLQVFSLCIMSFALVLILGGGPPNQTLETAIFAKIRYGSLDFDGAVACAFWQMLLSIGPWLIWLGLLKRSDTSPFGWELAKVYQNSQSRRRYSGLIFAVVGFSLIWILPYFSVFRGIERIPKLVLDAQVQRSIALSLEIAVGSAALSLGVALLGVTALHWIRKQCMRTHAILFQALMGLPSGVSVLLLSLGFWIAYGRWLDPFEGSQWAMTLLQCAIFYPLAYRLLEPLVGQQAVSALEAAASLGAGPVRAFWEVEWPRWRGPLLGAFALVVGASLGEVAAVSLFYSEDLIPLPMLATRWMGQYRFEEVQGLSTILLLLSTVVMGSVFLKREKAWK